MPRPRRLRRAAALAAVALAATAAGACAPPAGDAALPDADPAVFRARVYPILLADCGFNGCHGDPARAFAVFGPGRRRLRAETDLDAPVTAEELALSFTRARAMLVSPDGLDHAPLLRKPLAVAAGGAGHAGTDPWGHAIYARQDLPRFQALVAWALAAAP